METIWREKCIGEIIGGYLQDCYVFIYNTHNVAIVKNRKIICYVNGDTVIEYSDKSQVQKKVNWWFSCWKYDFWNSWCISIWK